MLIERELEVHSIKPDSLDVCPRGSGCYSGFCEPTPAHRFREPIYAAGFKYEICPVCGTVRISECSEHGLLGRIRALVGHVEVDLDAPLSPDDE